MYQPKVALNQPVQASGRCPTAGFEALLRWHHPRRGVVAPAEFLPLAESLPLMDDLTDLVIGEALERLQEWRALGLSTSLAINVSAVNLHAADFTDRLVERCRKAAVAHDREDRDRPGA